MTINVTIADASLEADQLAALHVVNGHNARLEAAATEEEPAVLLPVEPAADLKTSYETVLGLTLERAHASYQKQAAEKALETQDVKDLWKEASLAQRAAAVAALQS